MKYTLFIFYTLLTTWLSLMPSSGSGLLWDKAVHFIGYAIFALLGAWLCRSQRQLMYMSLAIFAYSGLMEFAQGFVPGRDMSFADLVANGMGVGVVLGVLWSRLRV